MSRHNDHDQYTLKHIRVDERGNRYLVETRIIPEEEVPGDIKNGLLYGIDPMEVLEKANRILADMQAEREREQWALLVAQRKHLRLVK